MFLKIKIVDIVNLIYVIMIRLSLKLIKYFKINWNIYIKLISYIFNDIMLLKIEYLYVYSLN